MPVRSAKDIRDKLYETCCKCKQVRDKVETQRVLQDAVETGPARPTAEVGASSSFVALPNQR